MLDWLAVELGVSTRAAAIVLTFLVAQVATQVCALVDLARRESVPGNRKWVWALVIVLGNLIGVIVYVATGRARESDVAAPTANASRGDAARRAVDVLYGAHDWR